MCDTPEHSRPCSSVNNKPADEHGASNPEGERVQALRPAVGPLGRLETIWRDTVVAHRFVEATNLEMHCDEADKDDRERRIDENVSSSPTFAPSCGSATAPRAVCRIRRVWTPTAPASEQQFPRH